MSRLINQPCGVSLVNDPDWGMRPARVTWRGNVFRIGRVIDHFRLQNRWWERELPSSVWRLELERGGVIEVEQIGTEFKLYRILD